MERKSRGQTLLIVVLAVSILIMSIGFAGMNKDVVSTGNVTLGKTSWSIHFLKNTYTESTGSIAANPAPTIGDDTTSITYSVKLDKPGDYHEFTVDVINDGDFDAKLSKITIEANNNASNYASYAITYDGSTYSDTTTIENSYLKHKDVTETGIKTMKVRVDYLTPTSEEELLSEDLEFTLTVTLSYVQDEDAA